MQNQYDTEYLVQTNVTDILNINVAFDGYPTAGQQRSDAPARCRADLTWPPSRSPPR